MSKTELKLEKEPEVENPIFIEGLAGIGHIGRNCVSYIADNLGAEKIGEIHSHHFPPYTIVTDEKEVEMIKNNIYQLQRDDAEDIILLEGNAQASNPEGHYDIAEQILSFIEDADASEIVTIGGYGTGDVVEDPEVFGAVTDGDQREKYREHLEFDHDVGQIVGVSGLLVSMGEKRGFDGVCILGETPGFLLSDPKSTEAVLQALEEILEVDLDYSDLDDKVQESQEVLKKLQNLKDSQSPDQDQQKGSDLGYIG
ncbi:MAG: proteasome assembly chaperone family protein [Candidatus Nanohalobium sp.]